MKFVKYLIIFIAIAGFIGCATGGAGTAVSEEEPVDTTGQQKETIRYSDAERYYSFAFEHMRQGNYMKAESLLQKSIKDSTTYVDAYVALRKVYLILADSTRAVEVCKEGLYCLRRDISEEEQKKYENARDKLSLALADLYAKMGDPSRADSLFSQIIQKNPEDANSYDLYASYLRDQGKIDEAIKYYKKAYQYEPDNKGLAFRLGDAYFEAGRYRDAVKFFKNAKDAFEGDIDVIKKLAESYMELEEYQSAIKQYREIIEIAPKHVGSRIKIGNAYVKLNQYSNAKEYYLEALEIEPDNISIYYQLINLELSRNNLSGVRKYINEGFDIKPDDPILLALNGEYYYRLGIQRMKEEDWNPSIDRFQRAIQIWSKVIKLARDQKWQRYASEGMQRAGKMIKEVKKVRW